MLFQQTGRQHTIHLSTDAHIYLEDTLVTTHYQQLLQRVNQNNILTKTKEALLHKLDTIVN